MLKYELMWNDGSGAASRGTDEDNYVKTHINAENENEMWKIAYLLRKAQLIKSASARNFKSIKNHLKEDWGYEEDELKQMFEKNDYEESDLDSINLDDIDGGDAWIISIKLNGEDIYSCGFEEYYEDEDEDW